MKYYRVHDSDIPENVVFFFEEKARQMFPQADIEELEVIESYQLRFLDLSRFSFLEQAPIRTLLLDLLGENKFDELYLFLETNSIQVIDMVEKLEFKSCAKGYLKKVNDSFYHYHHIFRTINLSDIELNELTKEYGGIEKIKEAYPRDYEYALAEIYSRKYF